MDKLLPYLNLYKDHKKLFKTAVIVIIMIAAVVVFGLKGEEENSQSGFESENGQTVELSGEEGLASGDEEGSETTGNAGKSKIYVDISGQVNKPGVYEVDDGSRLFQVIEKAGGLKKNADTANINQAEVVSDGQKIIVPELSAEGGASGAVGTAGASGSGQTFTADGRININTADKEGLQEIPGVGPATADKIIAYRQTQGRFKNIEDIMNVSGIGEKTFEKIKDMLAV